MPEGPEIKQSADELAEALVDQRITNITVGLPSLKRVPETLSGRCVNKVECRGKAMLIHFDNGFSLYSHNQLYGKWSIANSGEHLPTNRSLRLGLYTSKRNALLYSASDIELWRTDELSNHPFLRKLGPDVLNQPVTADSIKKRLLSPTFSARKLSSLYLDQTFLAGLGNYLRSEILFVAGIHPDYRPKHLTAELLSELARQTLLVTERSYKTGGYTRVIDKAERANHNTDDYEKFRFMVFDREGLPCRQCRTTILKETRNSRRLYFCPVCQPGQEEIS